MPKPERVGPVAGLLALVLLVVNLVATRESPKPDTPTAKMVSELLDHRNAYVASAALILAQAVLLLVFVVAIAAVVDRNDSWIGRVASLAGGAASVLAMASAVSLLAAVFTVDHEPTGAAWVPIEFHTFFLASTAVPLAAFRTRDRGCGHIDGDVEPYARLGEPCDRCRPRLRRPLRVRQRA